MADAGTIVSEFLAERPKCAFLNMDVDTVALGLFDRIAKPGGFDQREASLCGPAAFMRCWADDQPAQFAQYVVDLYKTGRGRIGSLDVRPGQGCRTGYHKNAQIAAVDWIALASLRDSENTFLDYDSPSDMAGGVTIPRSLVSWFRAAGYRRIANETNIFLTKDQEDLEAAGKLVQDGHRVCLMSTGALLNSDKPGGFFNIPTHWVVMTKYNGIRRTSNSKPAPYMTVWSWGKHYGFQGMPLDFVLSHFFGYVSAVPPGR